MDEQEHPPTIITSWKSLPVYLTQTINFDSLDTKYVENESHLRNHAKNHAKNHHKERERGKFNINVMLQSLAMPELVNLWKNRLRYTFS